MKTAFQWKKYCNQTYTRDLKCAECSDDNECACIFGNEKPKDLSIETIAGYIYTAEKEDMIGGE